MSLIKITNLSKNFGATRALNNINLEIHKGEVLGLAGENGSGKSTLVKILGGVYQPDLGDIYFQDVKIFLYEPKYAQAQGIEIFHQEVPLCAHLSIADNFFLGKELPKKNGFIDNKQMIRITEDIFENFFQEKIDASLPIGLVSVVQKQLTILARALSNQSQLIILDEPTTALAPHEVKKLFKIINQLKNTQHISFIFISHMLDEIMELSDRIAVLRDGSLICEKIKNTYTRDDLTEMIAGKQVYLSSSTHGDFQNSDIVLSLKNLVLEKGGKPFSVELRCGEIIGVAGLSGSGKSELIESIYGLRKINKGQILIDNQAVLIDSPKKAIDHNIGFLPEDRKVQGLFQEQDILFNFGATSLRSWIFNNIQNKTKLVQLAKKYFTKVKVKYTELSNNINSLSGGNQQKILLSRTLLSKPKIFLMNEPTRGIDIGAKKEVCDLIQQKQAEGCSFIIASSELEELIALSNKIIVMSQFNVVKVFDFNQISKINIIDSML